MSDADAQAWAITYHLHPTPERVADALHGLKGGAALGDPNGSPGMIGFFAGLFAANPTRIDDWLSDLSSYSSNEQMVFVQAVWLADIPEARSFLKRRGVAALKRLHRLDLVEGRPWRIPATPMRSALLVDLVLGHFWATGDASDIHHIIESLGHERDGDPADPRQSTWQRAAMSLTWSAERDPMVMKLCQDALAQPNANPVLADIVRVAKANGDPAQALYGQQPMP